MHDHRISDYHAKFGVIVCSSTRDERTDQAGSIIKSLLAEHGHETVKYSVIKDSVDIIKNTVAEFLKECDSVIISGGTGITRFDVTTEAVSSIAEYEMSGFAHVFAFLSFQEIGSSAILSRASAYIVDRKPVFCLPGSPSAAATGVEKIILREIDHIQHELNR